MGTSAPVDRRGGDTHGSGASWPPTNEVERLAALYRLHLLDSEPSESFDRITRLAAQALDVPVVMVALIDEHRQWFKSRVGVEAQETPRDVAFCTHTVRQKSPLIISDLTLDRRFADNPFVTSAPFVRAYAGIPLFTLDGHAIGTLCAIDLRVRSFDLKWTAMLQDLAHLVQDLFHRQELEGQTERIAALAVSRERLFRDTFEQAAVGIVHTSLEGQLIRVNQCVCDMFGYTRSELIKRGFGEITVAEDLEESLRLFREIQAGCIERYRIEKRYRRKDGGEFWAQCTAALARPIDGDPAYIITVIEDISRQKQTEAELRDARDLLQTRLNSQSNELTATNIELQRQVAQLGDTQATVRQVEHRMRAIANSIPAFIGYWNRDLICEFANEAYTRAFGRPVEQIMGKSMSELLGAEGFARVQPFAERALLGFEATFERVIPLPNGQSSYFEIRFLPEVHSEGEIRGFFVQGMETTTLRQVQTALEAANAKLAQTSGTDYLTGLANREAFESHGAQAYKPGGISGEPLALILLDVDNLRRANDELGFDHSNEILKQIGAHLSSQIRTHRDLAARLDGGKFAMLCFGDLDEELLTHMAQGLRRSISCISPGRGRRGVTASFGLTLASTNDGHWAEIYARAGAALDCAKTQGDTGICIR